MTRVARCAGISTTGNHGATPAVTRVQGTRLAHISAVLPAYSSAPPMPCSLPNPGTEASAAVRLVLDLAGLAADIGR